MMSPMTITALPAFLLVVLITSASPGPAMALIFQRAGLHGFRAAIPTVLGLELGLFIWALAVGAGLAALVTASEIAFIVLRIVGAGFLIYLGIRALMNGWRLRESKGSLAMPAAPKQRSHAGAFTEGVLVQLTNPKAAVFLFAFYPQFLPATGPVLRESMVLGLVQVSVETVLYLALAAVVGKASAWFSQTKIRRRLEYVSGTVFILLGLRVAVTSST